VLNSASQTSSLLCDIQTFSTLSQTVHISFLHVASITTRFLSEGERMLTRASKLINQSFKMHLNTAMSLTNYRCINTALANK